MSLDQTFHALAHETRREMLHLLSQSPMTVSDVAAHFEISLNGVSKHLKVLEKAGLLHREVEGRTHTCSLASGPLREVEDWLSYYRGFWEERLDALESFLQSRKEQE